METHLKSIIINYKNDVKSNQLFLLIKNEKWL